MSCLRDPPVYLRDIELLPYPPDDEKEKEQLQKDLEVFFRPKTDPLDLSKEHRLQAEEELNENPDTLHDNIRLLREMIESHPRLSGRTDDVFLCAFLRAKKHDITKAFHSYKKAYEFKAKHPDMHGYLNDEEWERMRFQSHMGSLPGTDRKGRKLLVIAPGRMSLDWPAADTFRMMTGYCEIMLNDTHIQVTGITVVIDLLDMSLLYQARLVTPKLAWHLMSVTQDKMPMRVKAVHIVNQPFYFNALYMIFRPFLKKKLRNRLHLHGTNWESLHEHVPPEELPEDLGGTRPPFSGIITNSIIDLNKHHYKEWSKLGLTLE